MVKGREIDLEKMKEQDRDWRRLRARIHTQLDNAIYAFMYAVESQEIEVDKTAENYLIELLFDPNIIVQVENAIKTKKKPLDELITASRLLAGNVLEQTQKKKLKTVLEEHVVQAKNALEEKVWPFNLQFAVEE